MRALRALKLHLGVTLVAILVMAMPRAARAQVEDRAIHAFVLFDELEYEPGDEDRPVEFDALSWIGGDFNRVWLKARGDLSTRERAGGLEGQLLYGRLIAPFWDVQVGLRVDRQYGEDVGRTRGLVAAGFQGLAPYWFEVESTLFVSQGGDISARLKASYDLLFTQRVILQPELELNLAVQDVPEFGVRSGLSGGQAAARLRYEIIREFAPYIGISWTARQGAVPFAGGENAGGTSLVAGLRWWY